MSGPVVEPGGRHLIVTRFAVPHEKQEIASRHREPEWLDERLDLFRRYYVPSVAPLGVEAVLLCGSVAAERVDAAIADLPWARVEVRDDWRAGYTGEPHQTLTRLDSDDALHRDWFAALDREPTDVEVLITKRFLRLDPDRRRLHAYRRQEPAALAAFRGGRNPYRHDHKHLERHYRTHTLEGAYLLQVVHGANLSNRRPSAWRLDRRVRLDRLEPFGMS